jgi:hypothetical protein
LTRLTCKDKLEWSARADQAFQDLKIDFTTAPILVHSDFSKPFFLESDAFDYALRAVLFQKKEDKRLHPVAFHSRKFTVVEINYEIHNKELLVIVDSFQEWRYFLEGTVHPIIGYTDHKDLKYFMSVRVLNQRQAHWSISLSRFNFMITYCPGSQQGRSDALSRHSYSAPKEGDAVYDQQYLVLLKPLRLLLRTLHTTTSVDLVKSCKSAFRSFRLEIQAIICRF